MFRNSDVVEVWYYRSWAYDESMVRFGAQGEVDQYGDYGSLFPVAMPPQEAKSAK